MAKKSSKKKADENLTREESLAKALKEIEKDFGKGALMKLGERSDQKISVIPSGSLALDVALGVGGYPRGRIIEVYGPESSGKTTLTLHAIASVQKHGGLAAFIDAEHALDPEYAAKLGVDIDNLFLSQPDTGEQGLAIAEKLISSGAIDLVVVDSVAALTPQAEIDGDMGQSFVGLQARMMSQALRKLSASINKTKTLAIFINQLREKVGVMFGSPETTPGGRALKFYSTIRIDVRKGEPLGTKEEPYGTQMKIKIVKNKVAPPFKKIIVENVFGEGISQIGELIDMASEKDIIKKGGAWYSYGDDRLGQGKEKAKVYLEEHPEVLAEIFAKVREAYEIGEEIDLKAEKENKKEEKDKDKKKKTSKKKKADKDKEEEVAEEVETDAGTETEEVIAENEELDLDLDLPLDDDE
ncbi:recombination protein RecA [Pilibacter termitis]|uniref:Protein RecA n=1 Tax=Pilibacter termitis TaxID=263852 RepID=A0A1T4L3F5_9ENTE|nr:recombination protein RecA [Pilibacter termitis]